MSTTLSTLAMVAELQYRIPLGLTTSTAMNFLNDAYRWISMQASWKWDFKIANPALSILSNANTVALPADFDPGKLATIYCNGYFCKYYPMDEFFLERNALSATPASGGMFSIWTVYGTVGSLTALFGPDSAKLASSTSLEMYYHALPVAYTYGGGTYFPSADEFDGIIVALAEAEIRRVYALGGWDKIRPQAEAAVAHAVDKYRTTGQTTTGHADAARRREEGAADKSRRARD